jgi:hypothetical protein
MPDPVDELYLLPAGEFIAARDRLAAKLAAAKQRERARAVKTLRRPSVAAWVVNQLAHRHAPALRRLIAAGEVLRRAQRRVVSGGSADALRAAAKRRQEALRDLRSLAGPILREVGSAPHLDDVLATLEAASIDPAAATAVTSGRLTRELPRPSGFGEASPLTLIVSRPTLPSRKAVSEPTKPRAADDRRKQQRARELIAEAKRLEREAARSEGAAERASRRAATLEGVRREQERRVHRFREELQAAEGRLRDAEAELARARAEAERASRRAGELRRGAAAALAQAKAED